MQNLDVKNIIVFLKNVAIDKDMIGNKNAK